MRLLFPGSLAAAIAIGVIALLAIAALVVLFKERA